MKQPNLLEDDVRKLFFKYLMPSISATLVTSIYIMADTVLIGRGVGAIGIAALNLLLPLYSIFFGTGMLFGVGGGVLMSISKGRGDETAAKEYFTVACICTAVMGAVYLTSGNLLFEPLTKLLGRNETMDPYVREYGRILVTAAPVFLFSSFFQAFVRNDKAPRTSMAAVIAGGVSNVILDYIFIFPMGMGMVGGAIATVIGTVITLLILITHLFTPANTLKFVRCSEWRKAAEIVVNGLASFLLEMSNGVVMFMFNRQLLAYVGDLGVIVYGIISNSALIVASVCNGISQAAQPIMATNFGAGNGKRLFHTRRLAAVTAGLAGILFVLSGVLFPEMVTEAFVTPTDEILQMSVLAVRIYFLSFLGMGINILYSTYFQSVMKPGYSMVICLLRGGILNGILVFALPYLFGITGIWMTMVVTEFLTLSVCLLIDRWAVKGLKFIK